MLKLEAFTMGQEQCDETMQDHNAKVEMVILCLLFFLELFDIYAGINKAEWLTTVLKWPQSQSERLDGIVVCFY